MWLLLRQEPGRHAQGVGCTGLRVTWHGQGEMGSHGLLCLLIPAQATNYSKLGSSAQAAALVRVSAGKEDKMESLSTTLIPHRHGMSHVSV